MAEFQITPLDLTLSDLATWQREDRNSDYYLQAALGDQTIEWQGSLSVTPLYSSGNLAISEIDYKTIGHFLAPYLPYDLRDGKISVSSDYEMQSGATLHFSTSNGQLSVENLAVALDKQSEQPRLTTAAIAINDIGFDLNAREARVGPISFEQPDIALGRNKAGDIDWIAALAAFSDSEAEGADTDTDASEPTRKERPFRWSLETVRVSEGRVLWQDQQPASPAELAVEQFSFSADNIRSEIEEPVSYQLQAVLASGGSLSLNGQVTPEPFNLEAAISGSGILLSAFEPYLQESANLDVAGGTLGLDGNLDLDN